jgi:hypothetical protein
MEISKDKEINTKERKAILSKYIETFYNSKNLEEEFEIRFGTKGIKKITRNNFDNVIQYIKSRGFVLESSSNTLKIQPEVLDKRSGMMRISNIRVEIEGIKNIQKYCKTNSITISGTNNLDKNVIFTMKKPIFDLNNNKLKPIEFNDMNFRVSYQEEKKLSQNLGFINQMINEWPNKKKLFRYITRYSYVLNYSGDIPIRIDLSIVKSSKINARKNGVPTYSIEDSNVFDNNETYEIEIELLKDSNLLYESQTIKNYEDGLKKVIKYILSGLQETNYPVSYDEIKNVSKDYYNLIYGKSTEYKYLKPSNFIGPSSVSLELKHLQNIGNTKDIPNINNHYCITDKADGLRKLLYISNSGKIYLFNMMLEPQFTGLICTVKDLYNSLLDGEHILYDKNKNFINLYAIFDIYFLNGEDKRDLVFIKTDEDYDEPSLFRHSLIVEFIKSLKVKSVSSIGNPLTIKKKSFYVQTTKKETIYDKCKQLLQKIDNGIIEYETDGIIFTPTNLCVGCNNNTDKPINYKKTWIYSLKWKPPQHNSIDFLVTTNKTSSNIDVINNIFENGTNTQGTTSIKQYKTVTLRVGYDEKKHGYINPCNMIIKDELPKYEEAETKNDYKPVPFYPSEPVDPNASVCNIILTGHNNSMFTEDGQEEINDNMIVEFRYEKDNNVGWRWIPIKVRYDKTAEFRSGIKNFGNDYNVAQSVWNSIHNPITKTMIITGKNIPIINDDIYYNRNGSVSMTKPLRDFHNLYVKNKLIKGVSKKGDILYDLAVGKGGDISKWINSGLSFVFGVDISKDNIENRIDGACARYLNYKKKTKNMPNALFVNANSSLNIKNGNACFSDRGKSIVNSVFGVGSNDESVIGKGVSKNYGVGKDGFNIVSCQFAIHYFFENKNTLHNFLKNVSDGCAIGGYFIGTSYDGKQLFNELKNKKQNESIIGMEGSKKIYEITKKYDNDVLKDDETCIGYAIDVYQETINKVFREYLVNYDYLNRLMEHYGFRLISKDEAKMIKLPNGSGSFKELYNLMKYQLRKEKEKKVEKTINEIGTSINMDKSLHQKYLSFLNRYFVYKKINNVNTDSLLKDTFGIKSDLQTVVDVDVDSKVVPPVVPDSTIIPPVIPEKPIKELTSHTLSIIVPFRDQPSLKSLKGQDRMEHKRLFTEHMNTFIPKLKLQAKEKYNIDLSIYILFAEQTHDGHKFNRGALLNSGYLLEKETNNPDTVIFHDVDLLPNDDMIDNYVRPLEKGKKARHLVHDWGRYGESKYSYFGGVTLFNSEFFYKINGFPNYFEGWGGEDDALRNRIVKHEKLSNMNEALTSVIEYPKINEDSYNDLENIKNVKDKRKLLKTDSDLDNVIRKENKQLDKAIYKLSGLVNKPPFNLSSTLYNITNTDITNDFIKTITFDLNDDLRNYEKLNEIYNKLKDNKTIIKVKGKKKITITPSKN